MSRIFHFEIHRAPSELLLPSANKSAQKDRQVSLKRLGGLQKKSRTFFIIIFKLKNVNFKTQDFSPLIE